MPPPNHHHRHHDPPFFRLTRPLFLTPILWAIMIAATQATKYSINLQSKKTTTTTTTTTLFESGLKIIESSSTAFQLPTYYHRQHALRSHIVHHTNVFHGNVNSSGENLYSWPTTIPLSIRKLTLLSSTTLLPAAPSSTGWIKADTLNFDTTIHNTIDSNIDSTIDSNSNNDNDNNSSINPNILQPNDDQSKIQYPLPSPVERLLIRDRIIYIKHDENLHLPRSNISGNKARKFLSLNTIPVEEFPDAIVSYGGPQSNAMVALAAIVSSKNGEMREQQQQQQQQRRNANGSDEGIGRGEEADDGGGRNAFWELDVEELEEDIRVRAEEEEDLPNTSSLTSSSSSSNGATPDNNDKLHNNNNENNNHNHLTNESTNMPKKQFIYYTKTMPRYLRKYPNGNLLRSLALGMEIRTLSHGEYSRLFGGLHGGSAMAPADLEPPLPGRSLWMPQGGACSIAEPGSNVLAQEIIDFWSCNGKGMPLAVCVPGGTCTTALLLHKSLNTIMQQQRKAKGEPAMDIRVVVIPCVGDDDYAMRQMMSLDKAVGGRGREQDMPHILRPRTDIEYGSARRRSGGYFTFGEPAKSILQAFDEMNEAGLFLDLLYGAPAWSLLLQHWRSRDHDCPIAGRQIMYVHSGGLEGIASQMTRYKHKGLLDERTIQSS